MPQHPIEILMDNAMKSIKEMVDVNTIIGDTVQANDGTVIIPVSRVSFGFASGGGEYGSEMPVNANNNNQESQDFPFAGGSGAGVTISPVAFMVVGKGNVKLLSVNKNASVDKILDIVPDLFKKKENKKQKNSSEKETKEQDKKGYQKMEQEQTKEPL